MSPRCLRSLSIAVPGARRAPINFRRRGDRLRRRAGTTQRLRTPLRQFVLQPLSFLRFLLGRGVVANQRPPAPGASSGWLALGSKRVGRRQRPAAETG